MNANRVAPCALKQPIAIVDKADILGRSIYGYHAPKSVFGKLATSTVCVFAYSANVAPDVCAALDHYLLAFDRRQGRYLVFETYEKLATYERRIGATDCQDCVYATLDQSDVNDINEKFQSSALQRDFFSGAPASVVCIQNVRRNTSVAIAGARTLDEHAALLGLLERTDAIASGDAPQTATKRENKRSATSITTEETLSQDSHDQDDQDDDQSIDDQSIDDQSIDDRWSRSFADAEALDSATTDQRLEKRRRTEDQPADVTIGDSTLQPKRNVFVEQLEAQKAHVLAREANEHAASESDDVDVASVSRGPIVDSDCEVLFSRISLYIVEECIRREWIGDLGTETNDTGVTDFQTMMSKLSERSFAISGKKNEKTNDSLNAAAQNRRVFSALAAAQKLHDDRRDVSLAPPLIEEEPLFPVLTTTHNVRFLLYDYQRRMINWLLKRELQTLMYEAYPLANASSSQIAADANVDAVCIPEAILVQKSPSLRDVDLFRYTLGPRHGHSLTVVKAGTQLERTFIQNVYPRIASTQALHNPAVRNMLTEALFRNNGEPHAIGPRLQNFTGNFVKHFDRIMSTSSENNTCKCQRAQSAVLCTGECCPVPAPQSSSTGLDFDAGVAACASHLQIEALSRSVRAFDYLSRNASDTRIARNPDLFRAAVSCGKTGCGKTTMIILMQWITKRWEDSFGEDVRIERNPEQTTSFEAMLPTRRRTLSLPPHLRNPQTNADDALCHVRVGRYYANCTLVVCPEQVVEQWFSEYEKTIGCGTARKRPKTGPNRSITNGGVYGEIVDENDNLLLQIAVVRDIRALRQLTISEIIQNIDVLIVNVKLFNSDRYRDAYTTFSKRYRTAVKQSPPSAIMRGINASNRRLFVCAEQDRWVKEAVSIERKLIRQHEQKLAEAFMNETAPTTTAPTTTTTDKQSKPQSAASTSSASASRKRTRSAVDSESDAMSKCDDADGDDDIEVTLSGKTSRNLRDAAEKKSVTEPGELFGMALLHAICFRRLVVDEAHLLSTRARVLERGVCSLVADFKHCVTATANFGVADAFYRSNAGGSSGYGPMLSIGGSSTSRLVQAWWDYRRQFVERCSGTTSDAALPEVRMHRVPVVFTQAETAIYSSIRIGSQTKMRRLLFCSHHMLNDDGWMEKNLATTLGTQGGASSSSSGGGKVSDKLMSVEEVANAMQAKRIATLRQHNKQLLERIAFFQAAWKDIADAAPEELLLEATEYVDSGRYLAQKVDDEAQDDEQGAPESTKEKDVLSTPVEEDEQRAAEEAPPVLNHDSMCQIEEATLDDWMKERSVRIAQSVARLDSDLGPSARSLRSRYTAYCKERKVIIGKRQRILSEILFYQNVMHRLQNPNEEIECPICMCEDNTQDSVMLTACGHEFCPPCAKQYFASNTMCPMRCRRLQLPRDLRLVDRRNIVAPPKENCGASSGATSKGGKDDTTLVRERYGSKLDALLLLLSQITGRADCKKIVIFAQFQHLLVLIADVLKEQGVNFVVARGSIRSCERAFHAFRNDQAVRIILLSSDKSISGVQLVEANHLVAVHPTLCSRGVDEEVATFWQAVGRIRRLMQRETCHVWQLIARGTVEEELYDAQTAIAKKRLAADPGVLWDVPNTCAEEAAWDAARKASEPKPCGEQEDDSEKQADESNQRVADGKNKKKRMKTAKMPGLVEVIDLESNNYNFDDFDDDADDDSSDAKQKAK